MTLPITSSSTLSVSNGSTSPRVTAGEGKLANQVTSLSPTELPLPVDSEIPDNYFASLTADREIRFTSLEGANALHALKLLEIHLTFWGATQEREVATFLSEAKWGLDAITELEHELKKQQVVSDKKFHQLQESLPKRDQRLLPSHRLLYYTPERGYPKRAGYIGSYSRDVVSFCAERFCAKLKERLIAHRTALLPSVATGAIANHFLLLFFELDAADSLTIRVINTGTGVHLHQTVSSLNREEINCEWGRTSLSLDSLTLPFIERYVESALTEKSLDIPIDTIVEFLYTSISDLGGEPLPSKEQAVREPQYGGSCATQGWLACLQSSLPQEKYQLHHFQLLLSYTACWAEQIKNKSTEREKAHQTAYLLKHAVAETARSWEQHSELLGCLAPQAEKILQVLQTLKSLSHSLSPTVPARELSPIPEVRSHTKRDQKPFPTMEELTHQSRAIPVCGRIRPLPPKEWKHSDFMKVVANPAEVKQLNGAECHLLINSLPLPIEGNCSRLWSSFSIAEAAQVATFLNKLTERLLSEAQRTNCWSNRDRVNLLHLTCSLDQLFRAKMPPSIAKHFCAAIPLSLIEKMSGDGTPSFAASDQARWMKICRYFNQQKGMIRLFDHSLGDKFTTQIKAEADLEHAETAFGLALLREVDGLEATCLKEFDKISKQPHSRAARFQLLKRSDGEVLPHLRVAWALARRRFLWEFDSIDLAMTPIHPQHTLYTCWQRLTSMSVMIGFETARGGLPGQHSLPKLSPEQFELFSTSIALAKLTLQVTNEMPAEDSRPYFASIEWEGTEQNDLPADEDLRLIAQCRAYPASQNLAVIPEEDESDLTRKLLDCIAEPSLALFRLTTELGSDIELFDDPDLRRLVTIYFKRVGTIDPELLQDKKSYLMQALLAFIERGVKRFGGVPEHDLTTLFFLDLAVHLIALRKELSGSDTSPLPIAPFDFLLPMLDRESPHQSSVIAYFLHAIRQLNPDELSLHALAWKLAIKLKATGAPINQIPHSIVESLNIAYNTSYWRVAERLNSDEKYRNKLLNGLLTLCKGEEYNKKWKFSKERHYLNTKGFSVEIRSGTLMENGNPMFLPTSQWLYDTPHSFLGYVAHFKQADVTLCHKSNGVYQAFDGAFLLSKDNSGRSQLTFRYNETEFTLTPTSLTLPCAIGKRGPAIWIEREGKRAILTEPCEQAPYIQVKWELEEMDSKQRPARISPAHSPELLLLSPNKYGSVSNLKVVNRLAYLFGEKSLLVLGREGAKRGNFTVEEIQLPEIGLTLKRNPEGVITLAEHPEYALCTEESGLNCLPGSWKRAALLFRDRNGGQLLLIPNRSFNSGSKNNLPGEAIKLDQESKHSNYYLYVLSPDQTHFIANQAAGYFILSELCYRLALYPQAIEYLVTGLNDPYFLSSKERRAAALSQRDFSPWRESPEETAAALQVACHYIRVGIGQNLQRSNLVDCYLDYIHTLHSVPAHLRLSLDNELKIQEYIHPVTGRSSHQSIPRVIRNRREQLALAQASNESGYLTKFTSAKTTKESGLLAGTLQFNPSTLEFFRTIIDGPKKEFVDSQRGVLSLSTRRIRLRQQQAFTLLTSDSPIDLERARICLEAIQITSLKPGEEAGWTTSFLQGLTKLPQTERLAAIGAIASSARGGKARRSLFASSVKKVIETINRALSNQPKAKEQTSEREQWPANLVRFNHDRDLAIRTAPSTAPLINVDKPSYGDRISVLEELYHRFFLLEESTNREQTPFPLPPFAPTTKYGEELLEAEQRDYLEFLKSPQRTHQLRKGITCERIRDSLVDQVTEATREIEKLTHEIERAVNFGDSSTITDLRAHLSQERHYYKLAELLKAFLTGKVIDPPSSMRSDDLKEELHRYLILSTRRLQLQHCLVFAGSNSTENLQALGETLSQVRSVSNPLLLSIEHATGKILRRQQAEIISQALADSQTHQLVRMPTGSGKTSLILPALAKLWAVRQKLPVIMVPEAQLEDVLNELRTTSAGQLEQPITPLRFDRSTSTSLQALKELRQTFQQLIDQRGVLVTTPASIQNLLLKTVELGTEQQAWLESRAPKRVGQLEVLSQRIAYLHVILMALKSHGVLLMDEADMVLQPNLSKHFPLKEKKELSLARSSLYLNALSFLFQEGQLSSDFNPQSLAEFLFSGKEFHNKGLDAGSFYAYVCDATSELPPGYDELYASDPEAAELVVCCRDLVTCYLPYALTRVLNVDYGRSTNPERVLAVPYKGNKSPKERSDFGCLEVLTLLTILTYFREGLADNQIKELIVNYRLQATELQTSERNLALEEFQMKFPGVDLFVLDERNVEGALFQEIKKQIKLNPTLVSEYIQENILSQIATSPSKIASYPEDLMELLFSQVFLCTATTHNRAIFSKKIADNTLAEKGIDGKALYIACQPTNRTVLSLKLERSGPRALIRQLLKETPAQLRMVALIDEGHLLEGVSNESAAEALLSELSREQATSILYWDTVSGQKSLLYRDGRKAVVTGKTPLPEGCFTYFDQVHCTGSDVPMPSDGSGWVTFNGDSDYRGLKQAMGRMRKIGRGQSVIWVGLSATIETLRQKFGRTIESPQLLAWAINNEGEKAEPLLLRSVTNKLRAVEREKAYESFLKRAHGSTTYLVKVFEETDTSTPHSRRHLRRGLQPKAAVLEALGRTFPPSMKSQHILANADRVLSDHVDWSGVEHLDQQVEEETEQEVRVQQESLSSRTAALEPVEPGSVIALDWEGILRLKEPHQLHEWLASPYRTQAFRDLYASPVLSPSLLATDDFLHTVASSSSPVDEVMKPLTTLLQISTKRNGKLQTTMVALSTAEAADALQSPLFSRGAKPWSGPGNYSIQLVDRSSRILMKRCGRLRVKPSASAFLQLDLLAGKSDMRNREEANLLKNFAEATGPDLVKELLKKIHANPLNSFRIAGQRRGGLLRLVNGLTSKRKRDHANIEEAGETPSAKRERREATPEQRGTKRKASEPSGEEAKAKRPRRQVEGPRRVMASRSNQKTS